MTYCVNHWEMMLEITNRWHYTPYRLAKFSPTKFPLCRDNCGQIGHLLHNFWDCPNLKSFWKQVFPLLSSLTGIISPPSLGLAVLHVGIDAYPSSFRAVVTHVLLAAIKLWKSTDAINILDFKSISPAKLYL